MYVRHGMMRMHIYAAFSFSSPRPVTPSSLVFINNAGEEQKEQMCRAPQKGKKPGDIPDELQQDLAFTPVGRPEVPAAFQDDSDPSIRRVLSFSDI